MHWTLALLLLLPLAEADAATLRVPSEYANIQSAVDAAAFGDTVLVAPGTYTESEIRFDSGFPKRSCVFMKDGVVLLSEGGPDVTTIDGLGAGGAEVAIVRFEDLPSTDTILDGFTITGAPVGYRGAFTAHIGRVSIRNCVFMDLDGGTAGGAGVAANGDLVIEDCLFLNCVAGGTSAAMYHSNGRLEMRRTVIQNCGGSPTVNLDGVAGGPVESALIEDCEFVSNWSATSAGALRVSQYNGGTIVRACVFEGNIAYGSGGGAMVLMNFGDKLVEDCLFVGNAVLSTDGIGGAAVVSGNPSCTVRGCTFYGNTQSDAAWPGAAVVVATWTWFQRNIVAGSMGTEAIYLFGSGHISPSCNVYWDNAVGNGVDLGSTDREVDPQFCDPERGDFSVRHSSPCLEPGSLGCGQIGAFGEGCGPLSIEPATWARIKAGYRDD